MSSIFSFTDTAWAEALAWAVLHSLWQASLIAMLLRVLLQFIPMRRVRIRYNVAYGALVLQGLAFGLTIWWIFPETLATTSMASSPSVLLTTPLTPTADFTMGEQLVSYMQPYLPVILWTWLLGLCFFLIRLGVGLWKTQQLRYHGLSAAPPAWLRILAELREKWKIKYPTHLLLSDRISSPMMLGQFKPLILLPLGLVNQLTAEEVELVLIHELAHLQRYDFVFNIIQSVLEAVFYYHPAVWWTGNQIRNLREACCDEWVTTTPGRSLQYARTLLALAEQAQSTSTNFELALLGNRRGALYQRIQHILNQPTKKQTDMREKFAVTALLVLLAIGVTLHAASADQDRFAEVPAYEILADTLPPGDFRINIDENGESMDVEIADQQIKRLKINGENIPAARFPEYEEMVAEKLANIPPPPPPPPAPSAPAAPAPPSPPAAPSAPAPPAPPLPGGKDVNVIIVETEEDGVVIQEIRHEVDRIEFDDIDAADIARMEVVKSDDPEGMSTIIITHKNGDTEELKVDHPGDIRERRIRVRSGNEEAERFIIKREIEHEYDEERAEIRIIEREHTRAIAEQAKELARLERELERQRQGEIKMAAEEVARFEAERERLSSEIERMAEEMVEVQEMTFDFDVDTEHVFINDGEDWLTSLLHAKGYLPDLNNYNLKLDEKRLKVNGKRLPNELHDEVLEVYEAIHGKAFRGAISRSEQNN